MTSTWQIIIAERGWVYVGCVHRDGDMVVIDDCSNIRRWGTTTGLGELAFFGPKSETILDPYGTVKVHVLAVIGNVDCSEDASKAFEAAYVKSTAKLKKAAK